MIIIQNAARCNNCGTTVVSTLRHDYKTCSCFHEHDGERGIFVDGGSDYFRRGGNEHDLHDLSIWVDSDGIIQGDHPRQGKKAAISWIKKIRQELQKSRQLSILSWLQNLQQQKAA
jgi:hypothetical protein